MRKTSQIECGSERWAKSSDWQNPVPGAPSPGVSLGTGALPMSAVDDRRRLVGDELPDSLLAHPYREIAIVNVHHRAGRRDLGRHPSSHERGAIDNQYAVRRMRDLEV